MKQHPGPYKEMRADGNTIRKAWRAGKKQVWLNGILMDLKKRVRTRTVAVGPPLKPDEQILLQVTESWIGARPADGSMLPVYCVELTRSGNGIARSK